MPTSIKVILSIIVFALSIGVYLFQDSLGQDLNKWIVIGLGAFMIFSLWLFPDTQPKE